MVNSSNNTVWVGQQINLTNMVLGSATNAAVTSYHWAIPGANNTTNDTAFYDYQPNAENSNYTNLFTPTNYLTNSHVNFYWSSGGSNQVVYCTNVIYGQTNVVSATFNVSRPTNCVVSATPGNVGVGVTSRGVPILYDGLGPAKTLSPGISFNETMGALPPGFTATNVWNQIINQDAETWTTGASSMSSNRFGYDGANDDEYPYDVGDTTRDSPRGPLPSTNTALTRAFRATMYFMWQPASSSVNGDKTVVVPLRSYQWNWQGTATNGAPSAGWGLEIGTNYPGATNVDVTVEPQWSTNAFFNWNPYP